MAKPVPILLTDVYATTIAPRVDLASLTPDDLVAHRRHQNRAACRRRDARAKAAKLGLEGPPLITNKRPTDAAGVRAYEAAKERVRRAQYPELYKGYEQNRVRPEDAPLKRQQHYQANKPHIIQGVLSWQARNQGKVRLYQATAAKRAAERRAADPVFKENLDTKRRLNENARLKVDHAYRLLKCLRASLYQALRLYGNGRKTESTRSLIGCSMEHFVAHIERQFSRGMTWENHGKFWEIDHVRPCASYDLTDPEQQKACFRFTNLRPLTKLANRKKSARLLLLL